MATAYHFALTTTKDLLPGGYCAAVGLGVRPQAARH